MTKPIKLLAVLMALAAGSISKTTNNPEGIERKQLFDHSWKFHLGDLPNAKDIGFDDSAWRNLDLPHDWSIEGKTDPQNPSGNDGGYFPTGIGWYRKAFRVPENWKGKKVSIYFEGVYTNAEVFINGTPLGVRPYGYSSFCHDLTAHLKYDQENIIAVRVDNSQQKNCRWYSGSGIYRHTWLLVTNPIHVAHWGVSITSPEVSPEKATVQIKTLLKNETDTKQALVLSTGLRDINSGIVGSDKSKVEVEAHDQKEVTQTIRVKKPMLWTPENPHLYQAQIKILEGKKEIDNTEHTFGIRSIAFSTENGFQLNGQKVLINGGCVHHDNGCLGAAAYDRAEERKVELLKSAGFNAVRTSHNPPSEAFLDACDRLGLLVMDESFDGWREKKTRYDYAMHFDKWWKHDIESMVLRDRNHPSIFMWSIGNEIIERTKPEAIETADKLARYVRELDPTRPVTSAMTTWGQGWERFDSLFAVHDVGGYNYQLHHAPSDHKRVPSRIIVQTESYPRDAFTNWKLAQENEYIIGDFVWTAMDYLGESSIGRYYYPGEPDGQHWEKDFYPWHGAYCGDVDLTGWRKPISHYRSLLWTSTEKLYMAVREPNPDNGKIKETMWSVWPTWESWNWPGYEGKEIEVEVYSKYPKVQLYLDDELIGEKPTTKEQEYKATFTVPYTSGTLKAIGLKEGKEAESTTLKTSGPASKIELEADRSEILANGQDLTFVTVEIIDQEGTLKPNAESSLKFEVEGPGVIAGVDNANLKDTEPYLSNTRKVWNGRALVVIKSTQKAGEIMLKVSSEGLQDSYLKIVSKEADPKAAK